ncbi:uncharacterized protein LOC144591062 [Rhinoraja longicauda]
MSVGGVSLSAGMTGTSLSTLNTSPSTPPNTTSSTHSMALSAVHTNTGGSLLPANHGIIASRIAVNPLATIQALAGGGPVPTMGLDGSLVLSTGTCSAATPSLFLNRPSQSLLAGATVALGLPFRHAKAGTAGTGAGDVAGNAADPRLSTGTGYE